MSILVWELGVVYSPIHFAPSSSDKHHCSPSENTESEIFKYRNLNNILCVSIYNVVSSSY